MEVQLSTVPDGCNICFCRHGVADKDRREWRGRNPGGKVHEPIRGCQAAAVLLLLRNRIYPVSRWFAWGRWCWWLCIMWLCLHGWLPLQQESVFSQAGDEAEGIWDIFLLHTKSKKKVSLWPSAVSRINWTIISNKAESCYAMTRRGKQTSDSPIWTCFASHFVSFRARWPWCFELFPLLRWKKCLLGRNAASLGFSRFKFGPWRASGLSLHNDFTFAPIV